MVHAQAVSLPDQNPATNACCTARWRALRLVAAALLAFSASTVAAAEATVQRFATAEFLPYIDAQAPEGGYYPALVRRVLAHHGARAEFVDRPWARAHDETRRGRFDGSFPYRRSAARERDFLFSDPLLTVPARLFVRRDQANGPSGVDRDRNIRAARRTCYLRDSLLPAPLEARAAGGELAVVRVDDMAQCFRMLEAGRVDMVPAGIYNGRSTLRRMYGDAPPIVAIGETIDVSTLHLVWPRSDPRAAARRDAFNASLAELRASGEVAALQERLLPRAE
jgi:polar amino acid transport system substrate-binding protein